MKKLLFLLLILTSLSTYSQGEANIWYFGENAGLDFNFSPPRPINDGQINTREGCSSFADSNGNLVFYSDGSTVWNKNHAVMNYSNGNPGNDLKGDPSSTQSGMIVPKPESSSIYYLFTVGATTNTGPSQGFNYYTIDISQNNNLGEITNGPVDLSNGRNSTWTEKVAAVRGKDCNTFWVVSLVSNQYYSYKIDKNGVNNTPVISTVNFNPGGEQRGYLKLSPDGTKLAVSHQAQGSGELILYSFNNETGTVSNDGITLLSNAGGDGQPYGIEFSRSSRVLYGSTYSPPNSGNFNRLYQFDLTNNNIISTKNLIKEQNQSFNETSGSGNVYRSGMQLGPDGKIYVTTSQSYGNSTKFLDIINSPEKLGVSCDFKIDALDITVNGNTPLSSQGLPPFVSSLLLPIEIKDEDTNEVLNDQNLQYCIGQTRTIAPDAVSGTGVTYKWEFENTGGTTTQIHNDRVLNLPNLTTANTGKYILTVNLTDDCGNITTLEGTFNVGVFEAAVATPTNKLLFCDAVTPDGFNDFDLKTEKDNAILAALNPATFDVFYFLDEDDAKNNVTANALTDGKYTNAVAFDTKTIYARVHNKNAPNACSDVTSFDVQVTGLPVPQDPTDYVLCDDTTSGSNTDNITQSFKLVDRDSQILGGLIGYTVTYHTSKSGAENKTDTIDKNINRTVTNSETVYVRVENDENSACADFSKELNLVVAPVPNINASATIKQCVSLGLANTTINLTVAELNVTNSTLTDVYFEYYRDAAATNKITPADVINYPVVVGAPNAPVFVKTITKLNDCSNGVTQLNIQIAPTSDQGYANIFDPVCDDFLDAYGNDTTGSNSDTDFITNFPKSYFDEANTQIRNNLGNPTNTTISFFENQTDRTNSINTIDITKYRNDITKIDRTNITNGIRFPIYYKILSTINNDCQGLGQFYFQITSVPEAKTPTNFDLCDDFDSGQFNDGINTGINLRSKISEIFAGTTQTETNYDVTFYKSEADVISGNNAIPLAETTNYKNDAPAGFVVGTVSTQTIYVRVQNKTTGCFNNHVSFDININPLPTITTAIPDIEVCDTPTVGDPDSRNGLAQGIDLSQRDADVLNGRLASEFKVSYHRTRAEATAGLVSTELNKTSYDNNPNFTTLTNGIGEEILYISIENRTTGCKYGISTLKIIVYPEPNIPAIIDNYETCDNDNNGTSSDTDGKVQNIALINKKEQILANYPTTEHDNFKVTFHPSKALAESGDDIINENKFTNIINNQFIFVRVVDTRTGCVNDDLFFQIIVNPLPTFDEIDTPQIVCLNNLPLRIEVQNALTDYNYTWKDENGVTLNTNLSDDFLNITKGGNYSITATMKDGTGCERIRNFTIDESNIATITEADISIVDDSDNNSITIDTKNLGIGDYEFALFDKVTNSFIVDFQDQPFFEDLKGGVYSIYVRDKNGCDVNNIPVEIEVPVVEFPKFFTPNGDGKNDVWSIKGVNAFFFPGSTIYIFNRYGKVVGNISVNNNTWDGTYKGKPLPSDDYWFNIQLINKDGTARKPRKGHFSLLRTSN